MKNIYLSLVCLSVFAFGFSQSPIVTIDRANGVGPTISANAASINSSGLVRGSGVNLATAAETDFTSNQWNATTQAQAVTNNEYIEWSVSPTTSFNVNVDEFDIRLRRHGNGPSSWQIFYSLDNFATSGIAISSPQTMPATSSFEFNFSDLNIVSGVSGTITFRLYAWDAISTGGWLRVTGQPSWTGTLGVADPGIRLIGSVSSSSTNSNESDIIATTFDPIDNISYDTFNTTSGLTISNALQVGEFTIRDGGTIGADSDSDITTLSDIQFVVNNSQSIAALAIFDGTTNIAETSTIGSLTSFSGLTTLIANDDATKNFSVFATFKSVVTDNEQIQLTVDSALTPTTGSSLFTFANAGGAATPIAGNDNRIEVTANKIAFNQQPTDVNQFEVMNPYPTVFALDNNNNIDLDYSLDLSVLTSSGTLVDSPITYSFVNGESVLNSIVYSDQNTAISLLTFSNVFSTISDNFDVNGPLLTIALQDFDNPSPEWTFTNDITFFDNGWGTDGYYGIIDIASSSPLDYVLLSENILGENDLNDEGNGAVGYATITFATVDISTYNDVQITFDWDIEGYVENNSDAYYHVILDGVIQPIAYLLDGDGPIDSDQGSVHIDIPDATNTVALELRVRNNLLTGFSGFDNFKVASTFNGLLYVDSVWSPYAPSGSTGSDNAYVIDGTYTVGTNIEINNLYINNGATTSVTAGQSIVATTSVVNNGNLELNSTSTSYSSLISDQIQGEVIYNRHVNQFADTGSSTGKNDLIAAPVTNVNQTFLALRTANSDIPTGLIGGMPSYLFGPFDNNANAYVNYNAANDPSLIESGIGYRTASTASGGSTFAFIGDVETNQSPITITVGTGSEFNLVGNPYPSYITLSGFLADNNSEFGATSSGVYGYDGDATDGFTVWNQAYSDANPSALIAPGQGFLVSSKVGGGSIDFDPSTRSIGTTDDFILGRNANATPINAFLNLKLENTGQSYTTDLYFNENASLGMDSGYDAVIYNNNTPSFSIYSHLVENNTGNNMAVQSVTYNALDNVTIPIGINAVQGEQLTISIANTNVPTDIAIYLEDNVNNTFTDLRTSDYTIVPSTTLTDTGRFFVTFSREALGVTENQLNGLEIYTTANPKTIVLKGQLASQTTLQLYDIQGRLVNTQLLNTRDTKHSVDVSSLSTGIYIVQLQSNKGQRSQKIILK